MQNVLNHVSDRSSRLTGKRGSSSNCGLLLAEKKKEKILSVRSMAVIIQIYVIRDVFVLFTFAKVEVIWFDTLVSDHQSLALLRVLHIN